MAVLVRAGAILPLQASFVLVLFCLSLCSSRTSRPRWAAG
jgi:hypothetical protein